MRTLLSISSLQVFTDCKLVLCYLVVINYDTPGDADSYLHRVGRAGRFGTKGLAITFVSSEDDQKVLDSIQARFEVAISELPDSIDSGTYSELRLTYHLSQRVLLTDDAPSLFYSERIKT